MDVSYGLLASNDFYLLTPSLRFFVKPVHGHQRRLQQVQVQRQILFFFFLFLCFCVFVLLSFIFRCLGLTEEKEIFVVFLVVIFFVFHFWVPRNTLCNHQLCAWSAWGTDNTTSAHSAQPVSNQCPPPVRGHGSSSYYKTERTQISCSSASLYISPQALTVCYVSFHDGVFYLLTA